MGVVQVRHVQRDRFEVTVRGHSLSVDQPIEDGGDDTAPTPTELFVASLAACVGHYVNRYLIRHDLPTDGLGVDARFEFASRPTRVGEIAVSLQLPPGIPANNLAALLAVAGHCTVHNSLERPPSVRIDVSASHAEAA